MRERPFIAKKLIFYFLCEGVYMSSPQSFRSLLYGVAASASFMILIGSYMVGLDYIVEKPWRRAWKSPAADELKTLRKDFEKLEARVQTLERKQ